MQLAGPPARGAPGGRSTNGAWSEKVRAGKEKGTVLKVDESGKGISIS